MSREKHLWIRFFHSIDLRQLGTSKFETSICRAEILEEKWNDEDALQIIPNFWRAGVHLHPGETVRSPIAIMGDYPVIQAKNKISWFSTQNGPGECPVFTLAQPSASSDRVYMDPLTGTLYLLSFLEHSL